jgi:hypothetical protein
MQPSKTGALFDATGVAGTQRSPRGILGPLPWPGRWSRPVMVRRIQVDFRVRNGLQERERLSFREIVERGHVVVLERELYILREHILDKNTNLTSCL